MTIGQRIHTLRKRLKIPQSSLAEAIGVSKQHLYKYEHDIVHTIPYDKIIRIAELLYTTPAYLLGWEGESGNCTLTKKDVAQWVRSFNIPSGAPAIFCGKAPGAGEWIYGSLINDNGLLYILGIAQLDDKEAETPGYIHIKVKVLPDTIGIFTGFYDTTPWKNLPTDYKKAWHQYGLTSADWKGKPIFTGDIVSYGNRDGYSVHAIAGCGEYESGGRKMAGIYFKTDSYTATEWVGKDGKTPAAVEDFVSPYEALSPVLVVDNVSGDREAKVPRWVRWPGN